ncbi:hypothetical protein TNCT_595311 [Trichonephila clavata]|uniref:Uncharacterized protein n=1 Tax=Trichonephila clavata TaxID=2740835 RepID=A0A8X6I938_TRICU|nr:hypothetical protein TNCT_595311 [Trichonephila clavata]
MKQQVFWIKAIVKILDDNRIQHSECFHGYAVSSRESVNQSPDSYANELKKIPSHGNVANPELSRSLCSTSFTRIKATSGYGHELVTFLGVGVLNLLKTRI